MIEQYNVLDAPLPLARLYASLDALISGVLARSAPRAWHEDHLSYSICEAISARAPLGFVSSRREHVRCDVEMFKNDGVLEERHGDIAIVLSIARKDAPDIFGFGFLEAKRRYVESGRFDALKPKQFVDILQTTPHAMVLLYDFEPTEFNANISRDDEVREPVAAPRALVMPMNLARAVHLRTTKLYRYCTPLAHQICYRYLHGLDLEMVGSPSEILDAFPAPPLLPGFVLRLRVTHEAGATPPLGHLPAVFGPVGGAMAEQSADRYASRPNGPGTADDVAAHGDQRREEPPPMMAGA